MGKLFVNVVIFGCVLIIGGVILINHSEPSGYIIALAGMIAWSAGISEGIIDAIKGKNL